MALDFCQCRFGSEVTPSPFAFCTACSPVLTNSAYPAQFRKHTVLYSNSPELARMLGSSEHQGRALPGPATVPERVPGPKFMCHPEQGKAKCQNGTVGGHSTVRGGKSTKSAVYPPGLCSMVVLCQECELAPLRTPFQASG